MSAMPAQTRLFLCRSDNYGVLLHDPETGATAAIDAPEAAPIEAALKATGWKLTDILVTHHHADHTDGIMALKDKYKCRVVAPAAEAAKIPGVDETVREGDKVKVGNLTGNVIETPGHTLGHIAYWFHADNTRLCRRHAVLDRLRPRHRRHHGPDVGFAEKAARPARTTRRFIAATNTPPPISNSRSRSTRTIRCWRRATRKFGKQLAEGEPTIPTTIGDEKLANPFLRADVADLACDIGMAGKPANEVFAEIRTRKNNF